MTLLDDALDLAAQGWAVFPCKWTGDDAKSPKTINGHLNASRDPAVITKWWTRWPQAMIGAPVPEAFIVVDVDPRNGGDLAELENLVGPIPPTLTVWSGRRDGGRHLYFQRPAGSVTSTRLPAGVDLKAAGYCIVPPSIHPVSGKPYTWVHRPVASMPAGLRELLRPPPPRRWSGPRKGGNAAVLVAWVERRGGNVNDAVYWAAKKAARDGVLDAIEDDLVRAADHAARAAGTWQASGERQTRRTIGSARRYVQNGGAR